jgi:hypothetical protein
MKAMGRRSGQYLKRVRSNQASIANVKMTELQPVRQMSSSSRFKDVERTSADGICRSRARFYISTIAIHLL